MKRRWIFFLLVIQACLLANVVVQNCFGFLGSKRTITDYSELETTPIANLVYPTSIKEVQDIVQKAKGPLSIAGARYSQGGHISCNAGTVIDMTKLTKIIAIDHGKKTITVQTGATWRQVQEAIDPYHFSVAVMQSYNSFTVGGSLSVNAHGRYIGFGPIIQTVLSIKIVVADGSLKTASRTENSDLFYAAIGGYGALGVIVEATLLLTDNCAMERFTEKMTLEEYPAHFKNKIKNSPTALLHNAELYPPLFNTIQSITWHKTSKEPSAGRLQLYSSHPFINYAKIAAAKQIPFIQFVRPALENLQLNESVIVWRNYEASYAVSDLFFPKWVSVSLLQEFFIPVDHLIPFMHDLTKIITDHSLNVLNVSIRHVTANNESILSWSTHEAFAVVIFYDQWKTSAALRNGDICIKKLISAALTHGGTYYLPYKLTASQLQFNQAFPQAPLFWKIKKRYDPTNTFSNQFLKTYFE